MIPVLYDENETSFASMGLGSLPDATAVTVRRVLNGQDELTMSYPVTGKNYKEIKNLRHILVEPEYKKAYQAYRIYRVSKPMNGIITVNARHISERRLFTLVEPFEADTLTEAMVKIGTKIVGTNPFTFYTNKAVTARYSREVPSSLGSVLGGSEGSFLDVYGGEYEFDMYQVRLLSRRGLDRGVSVTYAKNLTKLEVLEAVDESVITSVCPIWTGEDDFMYMPTYIVDSQYAGAYPFKRVAVVDFSEDFSEKPTAAQLETAAEGYIDRNNVGIPNLSIKVSFEHLAQYDEYKQYGILETLNLGDTVTIRHADLDVDITARIVETNYDALAGKYKNVIVGKVQSNMSSTLKTIEQSIEKKSKENKNFVIESIEHATSVITGVTGGHVVQNLDANGKPYEILIMDTEDKMTATNVLRINQAGIGFSTNGYNGPFITAWTIDGHFVADFITAGTLSGNRVRTGLISDVSGNNYWNLDTGVWVNRALEDRLDNMQDQIDDNIQTWSGADVPTLNNYPASDWTTDAIKDTHIGDLYIISSGQSEGTYYRFLKTGNVYEWKVLTDTEVQQALAEAEEALRRVAVAETAIEQNTQAIALRATKTEAQWYATTAAGAAQTAAENTAKNYTDGQLNNYSTTTQMDSAIEAKANEIELSVSQTYTTKAEFDELAIGGRNLILNTLVPDVSSAEKYPRIFGQTPDTRLTSGTPSVAEHGIKITNTGAVRPYIAFGHTATAAQKSLCGLVPGETYTLSADVSWKLLSGTQNNTTYNMRACLYDDKTTAGTWAIDQYVNIGDPITPELKGTEMGGRCEFTFVVPSNATILYLSFQCSQSAASHYAAGDYIEIKNLKLEKGTQATDWTPAPEDTEAKMENLQSQIDVQADAIALKVSLTDYNGNEIASMLNMDTTTIKLSAEKIDLTGYVTISSLGAGGTTVVDGSRILTGYISADRIETGSLSIGKLDNAAKASIASGATAKTQYYISDSASSLSGGSWSDSPSGWTRGKYIWTRVATTSTLLNGATGTPVYSTAVYDENLTNSIATAYDASTEAQTAQTTASGAVASTTVKTQYYLSTSSTSAKGGSWQDTIPAVSANKYVWTRVATTTTLVRGTSSTAYTPATGGTYDQNLTKILNDAATAQSTANSASTAAGNAQASANSAVANTTSKMQYALSNSNSTAPASGWQYTIPTWSTGKYIWTRVETVKTAVGSGVTIPATYSDATCDKNLTQAFADAAAASAAAAVAQSTADTAVASTMSVYYRSTEEVPPTITASTPIGTSSDTDNAWESVYPRPKKDRYFYTCEQCTLKNGTIVYTAVTAIPNANYVASWCSQTNATYIDGGMLYTGSVSADKIAANSIFTQKLTATDFTITGGHIDITTSNEQYDILSLNYSGINGVLSTDVLPGSVRVASDATEIDLDASGIVFKTGTETTGYIPANGFKFIDLEITVRYATQVDLKDTLTDLLNTYDDQISVGTITMFRVDVWLQYGSGGVRPNAYWQTVLVQVYKGNVTYGSGNTPFGAYYLPDSTPASGYRRTYNYAYTSGYEWIAVNNYYG